MLEIKKGNIFTTQCQTIVNTVNCDGVMGAGIAQEFKLRYPEMFSQYKKHCENKSITIGKLWLFTIKTESKSHYSKILNFPTKNHWKYPTKIEYLEKGLQKFLDSYQQKGIKSIAFPLLGASNGGLSEKESIAIMKRYLEQCEIPVEIWYFDPKAEDDVYKNFKIFFMNTNENMIKEISHLRSDAIKKLKEAVKREDINSLNGLLKVKGIGETTIEKTFMILNSTNLIKSSY